MTAKQIVQKYNRLQKRRAKLDAEFATLKGIPNCDHSDFYEWEEDRDNGYGRWWKVPQKRCKICGTEFYKYGPSDAWRVRHREDED